MNSLVLAAVVSHPFARKKAKEWGTEFVQDYAVDDKLGIEPG
jgi:hypothetical protein